MKFDFYHTLLWRMLLPIILLGSLISLVLAFFLMPPLISSLEQRIDKTIDHTVSLALKTCEERLNDMLGLRMVENEEMNITSKKETIEEIKTIAGLFPKIRMMIFDNEGLLLGASFTVENHTPGALLQSIDEAGKLRNIYTTRLLGEKVLLDHAYFPFWRWHIVSFIPEDEYLEPIVMAQRIVMLGNFGTLLAVAVTLALLFMLRINTPLKRIIRTTREVRQGNFSKVKLHGSGEIERVAFAFDEMITKLEDDKREIDRILAELSESEEKYRILSENSFTLVFVLNQDNFQYVNRAAEDYFQLPREKLMNMSVFSILDSDQSAVLQQKFDSLINNRSDVEHFELCYSTSSEQKKYLEILASVISYRGNNSVLIHALDITDRKLMEQEQETLHEKIVRGEQMEMLGTLAGGVAHDLNNILSGVVSYPELLLQGLDQTNSLYSPLQTIQRSGLKAAAIVQDLLTLTRRGVVITDIVSLREIIQQYLDSPECENLLSHYPNITLSTNFAYDIMNIKGSSHHISKSIMNLITNAAEAMDKGGNITITLENRYVDSPIGDFEEVIEGEYVVVAVSDNGEGISTEDLGKIFEPFYTRKVMGRSGTGLGMSVVWGTVRDHKGYIDVTSRRGRGTTFTLYFPASRESVSELADMAGIDRQLGTGTKVLVIDDIEEQRLIASSMLECLGCNVYTAQSGEQAIALFAEGAEYDLVLLDMIMEPGMDGLDTYREILKICPSQKAIVASGFSETARVRSAQLLGAATYIKKPYGLDILARALKKVLDSTNPAASV